jgi:hypothetical protein
VSSDPILRAREETERTYELLRRSNERIRISLELLEHDVPGLVRHQALICKSCNAGMRWSRSTLDETKRAVVHMFVCPSCGERAQTETRATLLLEPAISEPDGSGQVLP